MQWRSTYDTATVPLRSRLSSTSVHSSHEQHPHTLLIVRVILIGSQRQEKAWEARLGTFSDQSVGTTREAWESRHMQALVQTGSAFVGVG